MARFALAVAPAMAPVIRAAAAPATRPADPGPAPARRAHPTEPSRPALEVVGPRRRFRTGPTVALGAVIAFTIAFAVVACQVLLVQGQQRLDRLDADITASTDRYHELRLQVAELEAPARIVDAASSLGMVPPPEVTYLTPAGAVTVAGSTAPDLDAEAAGRLDEYARTRPNLEGGG